MKDMFLTTRRNIGMFFTMMSLCFDKEFLADCEAEDRNVEWWKKQRGEA